MTIRSGAHRLSNPYSLRKCVASALHCNRPPSVHCTLRKPINKRFRRPSCVVRNATWWRALSFGAVLLFPPLLLWSAVSLVLLKAAGSSKNASFTSPQKMVSHRRQVVHGPQVCVFDNLSDVELKLSTRTSIAIYGPWYSVRRRHRLVSHSSPPPSSTAGRMLLDSPSSSLFSTTQRTSPGFTT